MESFSAQPLMKRSRRDLTSKYGEFFMDYTFEINSEIPATGEIGFSKLMAGFGFAKNPMEKRLLENLDNLPYQGTAFIQSMCDSITVSILQFI